MLCEMGLRGRRFQCTPLQGRDRRKMVGDGGGKKGLMMTLRKGEEGSMDEFSRKRTFHPAFLASSIGTEHQADFVF